MHTWSRLCGRLDRLCRIRDKIDLDRSGRIGRAKTSERDRRLHVIDLQPDTTKPRFALAWDLVELEQWTKSQVAIARRAVTEMKTDQCAGTEQRPRWLHSSKFVEDAL